MKRLLLISAAFVLLGTGCIPDIDLNQKVTDFNPFKTEAVSRAERLATTRAISFSDGLSLTIRPTFLGVTGTLADVLGDENGKMEAVLVASEDSSFTWTRNARHETEASIEVRALFIAEEREGTPPAQEFEILTTEGVLDFKRSEEDRKMLLPAFWEAGESDVEKNGILWLPKDAHARLKQDQKIEWSLGLGIPVLDTATDILSKFNSAAEKLFGDSGKNENASPFDLELVTEDGLFAVRIDGKVKTVEVLQAKSWFASYLILDNPDNPLILKVTVNPVAASALEAFSPLGVDSKSLGYEITEIKIGK